MSYKKIKKNEDKQLSQESKRAAEALRELYPDAAFVEEFRKVVEITKGSIYGNDFVDEVVRARIFPDKNAAFVLRDMKSNKERRDAYQRAGIELGQKKIQLVAVFCSVPNYGNDSDRETLEIYGRTPDGRELFLACEMQRDSQNLIQNIVDLADEPLATKGESPNIYLQALIAGYAFALRDEVVKDLLTDMKDPSKQ